MRWMISLAFVGVVTLIAGCGVSHTETIPGPKKDSALARSEADRYVLTAEPAGVKSVIDIRKDAKSGDEVVVVGRIGGAAKPFTEGRASFLIADETLKPTEGCDCPWDYCEYSNEDRAAGRLLVKFANEQGATLPHEARDMFAVKELSTVVVKGTVSRDKDNNVIVVASGLYVRPETK